MATDETPEEQRITELLVKNATETVWAVYEARVRDILGEQKKQFFANPMAPRTGHVFMPPGREQMELVASGILGGMMFERFEIQYEIGRGLEDNEALDGEKDLTQEARNALAGVMGYIRSRGPYDRAKSWSEHGVAGVGSASWEERIENEIKANTPRAAAQTTQTKVRYDESLGTWREVATNERPDQPPAEPSSGPGEATTELSVAGSPDPQPAGEAAGGGVPVAGRPRGRTSRPPRRAGKGKR